MILLSITSSRCTLYIKHVHYRRSNEFASTRKHLLTRENL